jgi:hypothetical protein
MQLNFKVGKSEALLAWAGPEAKHFQRQSVSLYNNMIPFTNMKGIVQYIHITKTYKHMGTKISHSDHIGEEVATRVAILGTVASRLRKIIKNNAVPLKTKINIVIIYMFSKGLYNSGTWPKLSTALYNKLHHAVIRIYRSIAGFNFDEHDDDYVIEHLGALTPLTLIRVQRIFLLIRVLCKAPRFVFHALVFTSGREGSWLHSVLADLRWLTIDPSFEQNVETTLSQWVEYIFANPKSFRKKVVKFSKTPIANISTRWPADIEQKDMSTAHSCDLCAMVFSTKQGLAVHKFKIHNVKSIFRQYIDTTYCTVCLNEFWTRERAVCHLTKSKTCWHNLRLRHNNGPPFSSTEAHQLDEAESDKNRILYSTGKRRHFVCNNVMQSFGPLMPVMAICPSDHHVLGVGHSHKL